MNAHPYDREKPDILCASNFICMWPARTCGIEAVVEAWVMGEAAAGIGTNSVLVDCDASSEDASAPVRFAVCSFSSMFRLKAEGLGNIRLGLRWKRSVFPDYAS